MAEINLGHVVGPGVPTGGATGKVLIKKSGADYDTEWGDAGTSDALPLAGGTMEGAINMDGNKVSNLPAPTASGDAVPKGYADNIVAVSTTQPTATENKLWVDTDASAGASYQVPTVAESIAMGVSGAKVGDLLRVNSVDANGKPTSWKHVPLCEIVTNRNMLDNWDFTNPVNQRGQATWSNANEYTIDRWKLTSGTASLGASGLTLNGTLVQIIEKAVEQAVTCSALLSDGSMITPTYNDNTKTFTITATGQTIVAAKLEIGSEQTLAHQENGVWVLNEIPDYGEELAECQKYFVPEVFGVVIPSGILNWNTISLNFPVEPINRITFPNTFALIAPGLPSQTVTKRLQDSGGSKYVYFVQLEEEPQTTASGYAVQLTNVEMGG